MTIDEALNVLKQYIDYNNPDVPDFYTMEEACEVVIEALEQEPCADAISRAEVLSHAKTEWGNGHEQPFDYVEVDVIKQLPPVTPQPKTGHWIDIMVGDMPAQVCDQCKTFYPLLYTGGGHNYCPSCGSRMVEPQESGGGTQHDD